MEDVTNRILSMKQYVDRAKIKEAEGYQVSSKELLALAELTHQDLFGAVLLAFTYGRAMGFNLAKEGVQK